jgi:hypothetical protein
MHMEIGNKIISIVKTCRIVNSWGNFVDIKYSSSNPYQFRTRIWRKSLWIVDCYNRISELLGRFSLICLWPNCNEDQKKRMSWNRKHAPCMVIAMVEIGAINLFALRLLVWRNCTIVSVFSLDLFIDQSMVSSTFLLYHSGFVSWVKEIFFNTRIWLKSFS